MFFPTLPRRELLPRSTYYDKHYRMTSAMIRARQQYLVKNIVAGVSLTVFVLGVCKRFLPLPQSLPFLIPLPQSLSPNSFSAIPLSILS